jgi:hypothetical protein
MSFESKIREEFKLELSTDDLLTLVCMAAKYHEDGHLTILKFTTGWKCMIGTPDLDSGGGRNQIAAIKSYKSMDDAIIAELKTIARYT